MSNNLDPVSPPGGDIPWDAKLHSVDPDPIVSVNARQTGQGNRAAKAAFIIIACAILVGGLAWFSQDWAANKRQQAKLSSSKAAGPDLLNPEKSSAPAEAAKLGSASGLPPVPLPAAPLIASTASDDIRPLRGSDGKLVLNAQGRVMGVDRKGNLVDVPAILPIGGESVTKLPLPGQPTNSASPAIPGLKPPSRYGGALFVGSPQSSNTSGSTSTAPSSSGIPLGSAASQSYADVLKALQQGQVGGGGGGGGSAVPSLFPQSPINPINSVSDGANTARAGAIGGQLYTSPTPVARAGRFPDQNLVLPKGRQADCILTGRISDEVPGFTSCVLSQNMYSDNGRVLLLERGSELSGEYGVMNQPGLRRLFVTWNRAKTPGGIEIDLSSPGSDALGTSGLPGHLDNRWPERIGAALLLSFLKDISVAVINNQAKRNEGTGTSITVSPSQQPGQNTVNSGFSIADEVVRQTLKVRPTLTINEGDRIAIYIARDLDFSTVYTLKSAGLSGQAKVR